MLVSLSRFTEATDEKRRVLRTRARAPKSVGKIAREKKPVSEREVVAKKLAIQAKRKKTLAAKQKKEFAAAAELNKAKRQARRAAIRKKKEPPKPPGLNQVPGQIAHCMMALHVKRGKTKKAAWNICRWAMTKYGYLKGPYRANTKLPKAVKMTGKGVRRSFQHGMEKKPLGGGVPGTGASKYQKFVKMFGSLEKKIILKRVQ